MDITVNIAWSKGVIIDVSLVFNAYNPWHFDALVQSAALPGFLLVPGTTNRGKENINKEGNVIDIHSSNALCTYCCCH